MSCIETVGKKTRETQSIARQYLYPLSMIKAACSKKLTILTILSAQFSSVEHIHTIVRYMSTLFSFVHLEKY